MTSRKKSSKKQSKVPFFVGGGILVLLVVALLTTGLGGDNGDNGGSTAQEYADVSVSGASLPDYAQDSADPAIGLPMPEVTGQDFDGTPVSITNDGRPKIIVLLTHW
jgi:hypothetical protein